MIFSDMKVEYIEHMGSDLSVVNAARVSFDKKSEWNVDWKPFWDGSRGFEPIYSLKNKDAKLIRFLARGMTTDDYAKFLIDIKNTAVVEDFEELSAKLYEWRRTPEHFSPFCHPHISLRLTIPIAVARQIGKHQIGFTLSEVSRRYIKSEPEFYEIKKLRQAAENVKQGSLSEEIENNDFCLYKIKSFVESSLILYDDLLADGVCPEQARFILPQNMMTTWVWTGSLYAFARAAKARLNSHAQEETRELFKMIGGIIKEYYPVSWAALVTDTI